MVFLQIDTKNYNNKNYKTHKTPIEDLNGAIMSNKPVFLLIYMDGCGPCNSTRPEWSKIKNVMNDSKNSKNIYIVDIDRELIDKVKTKSPSVAAFGAREDGVWHGQLVHTCDPTEVVAWLREATASRPALGVALQANGAPVSSLAPDLHRDLDCPVVDMGSADVPRACGIAYDAVKSLRVRHLGQSQVDRALSVAATRTLSDGWALDRKRSPLDIAPLVAWVHALWLLSTFEPETSPAVNFY